MRVIRLIHEETDKDLTLGDMFLFPEPIVLLAKGLTSGERDYHNRNRKRKDDDVDNREYDQDAINRVRSR